MSLILGESGDFAGVDVDGEDVEDVSFVACGECDEIAFG